MDILKHYVDIFNEADEECYKNDIENAGAYEWMKNEVPIFECPDKEVERAYYFRFWTYRKHIKTTEDGVVITEFLPNVPWSGKHNTINAAVGHHLHEGRWLKNADRYLKSYINFFLTVSDKNHAYSTWFIDAIYKYAETRGDYDFGKGFLEKLDAYYEEWVSTHGLPDGSFWSIDDRDAMEFSVSGTNETLKHTRGVRPTLNSYMCADARALSKFAEIYENAEMAKKYAQRYEALRSFINERLYEDGFYRAYHYGEGEDATRATERRGIAPREQIGYIPFIFDIPEAGREACFDLLTDPNVFYTEYGLTTVERTHPRFLYAVDHECLWNGYVWPFATSETLTALKNVAQRTGDGKLRADFYTLLAQYARSHKRITEDGREISWIDEVIDPRNGDWCSRTMLRDWGWLPRKGGYERGKDYNHSTFCDLVISGLVGVAVKDGKLTLDPLAPPEWDYYRLSGVKVLGEEYDITYDKTGEVYGRGRGLTVKKVGSVTAYG